MVSGSSSSTATATSKSAPALVFVDSPAVLAAKKTMERYFKNPEDLNASTATTDTDYGTPYTPNLEQRPRHLDDSFDMNQTGTAGAEEAKRMIAELHEEQRLEQVERNRNASPPDERFGGPQLEMVDTNDAEAMLMHFAAEIADLQGYPDSRTAKQTIYKSLKAHVWTRSNCNRPYHETRLQQGGCIQ